MNGGRLLLRTAEVAAVLGMSLDTFHARQRRLRALGFPGPVPGMGHRYDPRAIEAWLATQRGDRATAPGADGIPAPEDVPGWQTELDRRATLLRH